jgi:hypothetical protein
MRRPGRMGMESLLFAHPVRKPSRRRVPLGRNHYKWLAEYKTVTQVSSRLRPGKLIVQVLPFVVNFASVYPKSPNTLQKRF